MVNIFNLNNKMKSLTQVHKTQTKQLLLSNSNNSTKLTTKYLKEHRNVLD